jgi:hypothetical protein
MEFFKIRRDIPFMRHALVFNVISAVTFLLAVVFLAVRGLNFGVDAKPRIGFAHARLVFAARLLHHDDARACVARAPPTSLSATSAPDGGGDCSICCARALASATAAASASAWAGE